MAGGVIAQAPPAPRTYGPRAVRFIEAFCIHPEGDLAGQPLILHPFWKERLYELLEVLPRGCPACGATEPGFFEDKDRTHLEHEAVCQTCGRTVILQPDIRRYSEAYISTGAKSAKSTVMSAFSLYLLVADKDPAALGICAAESEGQSSNLLYGFAKYMCENSPLLKKVTEPYNSEILVKDTRARMRNVSGAVGTNDGPVIKFVLCEELHEWKGQKGRARYEVLAKGCTRVNSLMVAVTTAGYDEDSICYERYTYGRKVESGEVEDPRFYFHCTEAPESCDHRDPKMWAIANPLLGLTPTVAYMQDRIARTPEGVVRRYNLNQWTVQEEIWIPYGVWDAAIHNDLDLDPARPLYVGIDTAKTINSSAVGMLQDTGLTEIVRTVDPDTGREDEEEVHLYVCRAKIWENPYPPTHSLHSGWRMNNHWITDLCRDLFARFQVPAAEIIDGKDRKVMPGPAFLYDPWRFRTEADLLVGEGLNMIEAPQTDTVMIPASQALYEHIIRGQIVHPDDAAMKRQIYGATAEQRDRGWRISKPKGSTRNNDFPITLAVALLQAMKGPPTRGGFGVMWA